jgi:hypothetical protein
MNMKKYKRFKQWVFSTKVKVPSKDKARDREEQYASSSTQKSQKEVAVKMLETPITPKSLSLLFCDMRAAMQTSSIFRTPLCVREG